MYYDGIACHGSIRSRSCPAAEECTRSAVAWTDQSHLLAATSPQFGETRLLGLFEGHDREA